MNLGNKTILFLGDSITEGAGADCPEKQYVNLIAAHTGAICKNYGVSGTRIAKQTVGSDVAQYDLDFCSRVASMDANADVVIVFGGTNDYGHGDAPLGELTDTTANSFCGALCTLYESLKQKYPAALVLVVTPLHRMNEDNVYGEGRKSKPASPLGAYVEKIRAVAALHSLPILDLYADPVLRLDQESVAQEYSVDGLHPNNEGHAHIASRIIHFLENYERSGGLL